MSYKLMFLAVFFLISNISAGPGRRLLTTTTAPEINDEVPELPVDPATVETVETPDEQATNEAPDVPDEPATKEEEATTEDPPTEDEATTDDNAADDNATTDENPADDEELDDKTEEGNELDTDDNKTTTEDPENATTEDPENTDDADSSEDPSENIDSDEIDECIGLKSTECGGMVEPDGDLKCVFNSEKAECYGIVRARGTLGNGGYDDGYNAAQQQANEDADSLNTVVAVLGALIGVLVLIIAAAGFYIYKSKQNNGRRELVDAEYDEARMITQN